MAVSLRERFEYATVQDPSLNYCLWEYPPPAPAEDKFRSVNLLYQSFEQAGIEDHLANGSVVGQHRKDCVGLECIRREFDKRHPGDTILGDLATVPGPNIMACIH